MSTTYDWKPADFKTQLEGHTFPFIEDEDAYGVYGYGHHDKDDFARLVSKYDWLNAGCDELYTDADVQHLWAVAHPALPDERFTWKDVTEQTPGAFPLTLILR